jgi:hypothetical protein
MRGKGSEEQHAPFAGAADLVLPDLVWRGAPVPIDSDAVPSVNWPEGWEPVDGDKAEYELNCLRREVPPGHPLFATNVRAWATGWLEMSFNATLFKLLDGTGRVAVVRLEDYPAYHAEPPEPVTKFYDSFDDWFLASSTEPDSNR